MSQITIEICSGKETIKVKPHNPREQFPEFDEIEINAKGRAIGWKGDKPSNMHMQELGQVGVGAVLVSQSSKEIVFKKG